MELMFPIPNQRFQTLQALNWGISSYSICRVNSIQNNRLSFIALTGDSVNYGELSWDLSSLYNNNAYFWNHISCEKHFL